MTLSAVLTAVRELILLGKDLPPTQAERQVRYKEYFPALNDDQITDLAKIYPAQIHAYRSSIVSGQSSTLSRLFPLTFKLLTERWQQSFGEDFNPLRLVNNLNQTFPWIGYETEKLAESFASYISTLSALKEGAPYLEDAVRLESVSLKIRRHPSSFPPPPPQLVNLTVEELLERRFVLTPSTHLECFSFDLLSLRLHGGEKSPTLPTPSKELTFAYGSRSSKHGLRWGRLPRKAFEYLQAVSKCVVQDLALVCIESMDDDRKNISDEEKFAYLFQLLTRLLNDGAITMLED